MALKLLYVPLKPQALAHLCERAEQERRRPQDEAALIIERALGFSGDQRQTPTAKGGRDAPAA